jgi:hypothetical protein
LEVGSSGCAFPCSCRYSRTNMSLEERGKKEEEEDDDDDEGVHLRT